MSKEPDYDYQDSNGEPCTLYQLVLKEPEWAANRIRELEKVEKALAFVVDMGNRMSNYGTGK